MCINADDKWTRTALVDATHDRTSTIFLGVPPDTMACETMLRKLPDGSWVMIMMGGGDYEPDPRNQVYITRSYDEGCSWTSMEQLDFGFAREGETTALIPFGFNVMGRKCVLYLMSHDGHHKAGRTWITESSDLCQTWSNPEAAPGRLRYRTALRNHIVTCSGSIVVPYQHYLSDAPRNPRNGVMISQDGGVSWAECGDIRVSSDDNYMGWTENSVVQLADGRLAMIIRAEGLGGVLYYAESVDGGVTWPEYAVPTMIPNPGSKATLYSLAPNTVAMLHNPNSKARNPLAIWISFDGMKSWPYQRNLRVDLGGRYNYPDGFVSDDGEWLHFAFDHNRDKAIYVGVKLPHIQ